jgi:molybdopterin molybdotransferase
MALIPVEDALARLLDGVAPCPAEDVALSEADGRVLAADVLARRRQPPFDASAMDGYAVRAADIATVPAQLETIGESQAGQRFDGTVGAGQAVRIFTGAPVPPGADTILLQEDAEVIGQGRIAAREATAAGRHIRVAGLDFELGDTLLHAGRELDPAALSLAASGNHPRVRVVGRPLVAILATGDELVAPGGDPGPDQIIASNAFGVAAMVRRAGGRVLDLGIVADERTIMRAAIDQAVEARPDIIVTLGGASVGDRDLVQEVMAGAGMELDFWKIAMRPGKPLMSGRIGSTRIIGLPGNPVSSLVCAQLFLVPLVTAMAGRRHRPDLRQAVLGVPVAANDHRRDYMRARIDLDAMPPVVAPYPRQDSSMLSTLAEGNCLLLREPHAPAAAAGDPCTVLMTR